MVEIVVVFPLVVLFIFGIIQYSTLTFNLNSAAYGSMEGVRYAAVHGTGSLAPCSAATVQSVVLASMPGVPKEAVTVATSWNPNNDPGSVVTVSVNVKSWFNLVQNGSPTVGAKTQMTILQ
jgi:Flp pilus assembly protein TadG